MTCWIDLSQHLSVSLFHESKSRSGRHYCLIVDGISVQSGLLRLVGGPPTNLCSLQYGNYAHAHAVH